MIKPEGPSPANILILGDFPSERDVYENSCFSGPTGYEFTKILQEAGILRTQCRLTVAYHTRPPAGKIDNLVAIKKKNRNSLHVFHQGQWVTPTVMDELEHLKTELEATNPTVIVACGTFALWALTGKWSAPKWRGSCLETILEFNGRKIKVIPTYAPGAIMTQWELRPILIQDLKRAAHESQSLTYNRPSYNFIIRPSLNQALACLDAMHLKVMKAPTKLAVDVETRAGYLACVGIAWSPTEAICIPLMKRDNAEGYWNHQEEALISWKLYQVLTHPNAQVVGQNFIYDIQYFWRHLFFLPKLERDTMLAQHVCFSTMPKSLDFLASMYSAHYVYWKDEGKEWKPNDKSTEEEFWAYNCQDAVYTFEVDTVLQKVVDGLGLRSQHDFQLEMFWPVLQTMNRGILIDENFRQSFGGDLGRKKAEIQKYIDGVLGHHINLNSPKQLADLFYKDLGLPLVTKRKTGQTSTDEESMLKISAREPLMKPLTDRMIEFKSIGVLKSNFMDCQISQDGRIRTSYNIGGTWTFRFSSRKDAFGEGTNLQNPAPDVKPMFIPDPGYTMFDMDLDSADLRIVVAEAKEENMNEWFDAGLKPYVMIMQEYYHDTSLTKENPLYKTFKALCHGTNYLGQPNGLAAQTGLNVADVTRIQNWYFKRFPRIRQWQEAVKARINARRQYQNIFGYQFRVLERITEKTYNDAIASIPQSTVAILINKIYYNVFKNCPSIQILLQTHDSLTGQFPTSDSDACIADLHQQSQIILPYPRPIIIPTTFETSTVSYGACK
jgi:DNA polymerase I-like protein with 3'-5' exonuclease and polymerase domains/uracil-DNA glycosylase